MNSVITAPAVAAAAADRITLRVKLRNIYGRERIYPSNPAAEAIAAIAGTATLEPSVLRVAMNQLGAVIHVEGEDFAKRVMEMLK